MKWAILTEPGIAMPHRSTEPEETVDWAPVRG